MRIGLFTDSYWPEINGVATSVLTLFHQLTALGHEVHVFAPGTKSTPREKNVHIIASTPLIFLKDRRSMMLDPMLIRRVNRYRFDVIHTHSEYLVGMLGRLAAKMQHCTCLHTYHTAWEDYTYYVTRGVADAQARKLAGKVSAVWCNHCDQIIAPTVKIEDKLRAYGVTTPIDVIPTGLNIARFAPALHDVAQRQARRKDCGVPDGSRVILYIGRIAKEKNLEVILQAMPEVFSAKPHAVLVLIGEGPWIDKLKKLADSLGISDRVLFPGPRPWNDIDQFYAMGDVFVSASKSETQGLTYIEAMASGLCVVAQDDPCLAGVIEHGKNGLLFTKPSGIAPALLTALSSDGHALGQAAQHTAQQYSQEAFARRMLELYQRTLFRMTGTRNLRRYR